MPTLSTNLLQVAHFCHCKVLLSNRAGDARDTDYQEVIGWCLIFPDASFRRSALKGDG